MPIRAMYNAQGWVLGICTKCRRTNYVEPHGTTAQCRCSTEWTEHDSIPFKQRLGSAGLAVRTRHDRRLVTEE